jgi:hypothetical protein
MSLTATRLCLRSLLLLVLVLLVSMLAARPAQAQAPYAIAWEVPQGVVHAPGLEQAYLVIIPYAGSAAAQSIAVRYGRDGQLHPDDRSYLIPASAAPEYAARRFVIDVGAEFPGTTAQMFSALVICPQSCTVQLEQHPAAAALFYSGMKSVNAVPYLVAPPAGDK